jgi:hypothetical protein
VPKVFESTLKLVEGRQRNVPEPPIAEPARRSLLRLYFLDLRTRYAMVLLLVGLTVIEFRLGQALALAATLWLAVALLLAMRRPSNPEIDDLLAGELRHLVQRALRQLGDPETMAAPLALFAPVDSAEQGLGAFVGRRVGPDGRIRSPIHRGVVLVPMTDQLAIYSCRHDALDGEITQVTWEQHRYPDVVVRLEEDFGARSFVLELAGGRRLAIPVEATWQEDEGGSDGLVPAGLEKTVRAINALRRNDG